MTRRRRPAQAQATLAAAADAAPRYLSLQDPETAHLLNTQRYAPAYAQLVKAFRDIGLDATDDETRKDIISIASVVHAHTLAYLATEGIIPAPAYQHEIGVPALAELSYLLHEGPNLP